jgi:glutamine synthetase
MTLEQAKKYIKENGIKFILAQFVDIHGVAKTKIVPAGHLEMIVGDGAGFAGFALWGFGMGPHGPDLIGKGDLSTLTKIGWQPGFARITCDGYVNDKPYEYDSRITCINALKKFKNETGFDVNTGLEPEFFLLQQDPDTKKISTAFSHDVLEKPCYDYQGFTDACDFIDELVSNIMECGMDVYQIDHEDANGQYEINFTYADALKMADNYILFKMAATTIAKKHGFICSFMPKPFSHKTGNGMHMHISLSDDKTKNAFHDPSDAKGLELSKLAYQFLGGVMHHYPALTAIACPSVNSYKRLVVGGNDSGATWAPTFICYGDNNRTAAVRIPYGRLEIRSGDSSANPYLFTAAVCVAGLDGIKNNLDPGEPRNINMYETTADQREEMGIKCLPQSLHEALQCLRDDPVILDALGPNLSKEFIELKQQEWIDYHRHVSDWEIERYLRFY